MDPIGPWYATYNRPTTTGITSTFQSSPTNTNADPTSHLLTPTAVNTETVPSTTVSTLLLQTAAPTAVTLAGQPSPFNPGGFLSTPTAVGYDVFTPFFPHSNSKQTTHYVSHNAQPITQAQVVTTSKPGSPVESDIPALRSNYASPQQSDTYFEHQTAATSPTTNWSLSHSTTSPFGILPHESVNVSSPPDPPATTKPPNTVTYDNPFVTHYGSNGNPITGTDSKTSAWSNTDPNKKNRAQSPISSNNNPIKCIVTESSIGGAHTYFQGSSAFDSDGLTSNYSTDDQSTATSPVVQSSLHHQSCIVSTPNITPSNRISQLPSRSPVPTTLYMNTTQDKQTTQGNHNEHTGPDPGHDSSQSSPISFSIMDSRGLNNYSGATAKQPVNGNVQFQMLNQQQQQQPPQSSCRLYPGNAEPEYHHPARSKSAASTDSAYSSNTSQNGPDCAVVVPRRPSPLQAHSQASPLGHVPSPATYPMYNSPMASMSSPSPLQHGDGSAASTPYKTGTVQQQMTPPSPLDVTVTRPPSQQGQVVYSSVITRALGNNENKASYTTDVTTRPNYERTPDFTQPKQMGWDTDGRKFPTSAYLSPESADTNVLANQQMHRIMSVSDRQSSCMESAQLSLQDLSSCRGDSMSIVKNMHSSGSGNEQDSDELKAVDDGHHQQQGVPGAIGVKRKSIEKMPGEELVATAPVTDYLNRIPPPAHHNAIVNQQQQNGYVEYDRWNMNLPHTKLATTPPEGYVGQHPHHPHHQQVAQIHHTANMISNAVTHQHQSLLVPHHTTPTVSYFPTFHMGTTGPHVAPLHQQPLHHQQSHHPHDMHSGLHEMSTINMADINGCQPNPACAQDEFKDDKPQVIVPNMEEELGFLQQPEITTVVPSVQPIINPEPRRMSTCDPNSGFMTSYLKFLQGDKDSSPPPLARGRRASWNNRKPYVPMESNGGDMWNRPNTTPQAATDKSKDVPQIDYANDPRYFPLPKERKRQNFDSSDDGFSSDDELPPFGSKTKERKNNNSTFADAGAVAAAAVAAAACQVANHPSVQVPAPTPLPNRTGPDGRPKKGRPIKPGGPTDRKRKAAAAAAAAAAQGIVLPPVEATTRKKAQQLPRRESSRRKAKEKTSAKQMLDSQQTADPYDVEDEQGDSDSDPAWTPAAKSVGDDEEKRKKRGRPVISKRKKYSEADFSDHVIIPKRGRKRRNHMDMGITKLSCKIDEKLLASVSDEDIDISPFKHSTLGDSQDAPGEFVVIKSDLDQEYPPLWRIDGKTLLQKYEPFPSNGKTLYRNISTYSGWAPQNRHIYQQVPVKFWQQGKMETVVEFLRDEMILDDSEYINRFMKDTEKYQDHFEVYIQTLISQALDSNFLTEIFQEQDAYFLVNVKIVDEITEDRKQRLLSTTTWQQNVITALSTWPCVNVLKENLADYKGKPCVGCNRVKIHARVLLYGQPYNSTTLEGSPPDPQVPQEKDFLFCRLCQMKVALFNKVAHQKYLMFLECARRVADKRVADPHKDTTIILNELLADEAWLNQLFKDVRTIWAEIDNIHQQAKRKANLAAEVAAENNTATYSTNNFKPSDAQISNESQAISYNDQMSSNLS